MSTTDIHLQQFEKEILQSPRVSFSVQLKFYDIFLPVLAGIIIVLNLIIVFSSGLILRKRQQPRSTYIFLGNVALADMMTGVATVFGQYYPRDRRTEIVCCVQIGMIISATLASIFSIALIAVDRYLYILYGLQYQRYLSTRRARLMVLGTWILGGIVGFLPTMGLRNSTDNGRFCWLIILEPKALLLTTVSFGMLPLILIIVLYSIILKRALGKISEMRSSETRVKVVTDKDEKHLRCFRGGVNNSVGSADVARVSNRVSYIEQPSVNEISLSKRSIFNCCRKSSTVRISSVYSPSRWKAIKIVVLTTGCFFVTWFPYFLASALYAMCDPDESPVYCDNLRVAIASPLAILGLANSLLNPIIYAWWHNGFRASVKKIFNDIYRQRIRSKLCCCGHNLQDSKNEKQIKRQHDEEEQSITRTTQISQSTANEIDGCDVDELALKTFTDITIHSK